MSKVTKIKSTKPGPAPKKIRKTMGESSPGDDGGAEQISMSTSTTLVGIRRANTLKTNNPATAGCKSFPRRIPIQRHGVLCGKMPLMYLSSGLAWGDKHPRDVTIKQFKNKLDVVRSATRLRGNE
ncbi:unnamed protein product [Phytophthora fragariaefolia]|uniref:Unnamed protein product n=1 Tax=Phytophthora fragariaefolia TaxID=1490495 RepID=A0A9W6Y5B0_9STRA|nr:unnamed protein product [Phytophthora fragariaefolia]